MRNYRGRGKYYLLHSALYSEKFVELFVGKEGEEKAALLHFVDKTLNGLSSVKANYKIQFPSSSLKFVKEPLDNTYFYAVFYTPIAELLIAATQAFHEAGFMTKWMEHDMEIRDPRKFGFAGFSTRVSSVSRANIKEFEGADEIFVTLNYLTPLFAVFAGFILLGGLSFLVESRAAVFAFIVIITG
jgi:hypothetical protein